jgi:hypothetical protein
LIQESRQNGAVRVWPRRQEVNDTGRTEKEMTMLVQSIVVAGAMIAVGIAGACGGVPDSASGSVPAPSAASSPLLPQQDEQSCVAENAQSAVGQPASEALLEQSRLAAKAKVARFLRPDQAVTMEYLASRLNLELDEKNIVRSVRCG